MKWAEISIQTTHEATEAVANIFHDIGASGVVIEDPELINSYRRSGTWEYCDIPESEDTENVVVKAYLPDDDLLDDKLRLFEHRVNELALHDIDKGQGTIQRREVQDEDWALSWKNYFHPVKVGEKVVIKPSWEELEPLPDDIVVELDPGMAFGTGTHATTSMCIRALEELVKPEAGMTVFDVGTGSGVLAIVCAKLGAKMVQAVDLDTVAVRVAAENVAANHVTDRVTVLAGDLLSGVSGKADLIVANIIADVIIHMLPMVREKLTVGGFFVASGIIVERLADVTAAMQEQGFQMEKVIEEGGWAAIVASQRKG
ncbi:50S ribosomal protein L11 methyltransferase [Acetonema longum]|uniref:Ribosomal protein L11 methyltransferase n=1 Tax=Acetonema longum DSM 6540 TaxID=1009370 RepID=F7NKW5_9FIRM|nr:50S ribosomal protein L11 methyltransferase [Acetonema longum]EGO63308.1 ribosomal protein L11 methyltransferase [Acetonema longum DSM 6540]